MLKLGTKLGKVRLEKITNTDYIFECACGTTFSRDIKATNNSLNKPRGCTKCLKEERRTFSMTTEQVMVIRPYTEAEKRMIRDFRKNKRS